MKFHCTNPDAIEFTLEITMNLSQWKRLQQQLDNQYPAWDLASQIGAMIRHAEKEFYPEDSKP